MADGNKKKYIEYEDKRYILEDSRLPDPSSADNGKVLGVVNGEWAVKSDEGGESVTVDDALSTTSENPVQNKVVKAALDAKADASALAAKQDALTAGQNITISGNTISAYADSAEIAADVTDWLDNNVTPVGSAVVVDSSLSVEGAAADAKVTGDKLSAVEYVLSDFIDAGTPANAIQQSDIEQGGYTDNTGAKFESNSRIRCANSFTVQSGEKFTFRPGTNVAFVTVMFKATSASQYTTLASWQGETVITFSSSGSVLVAFRRSSDSATITPSQYDAIAYFGDAVPSPVKLEIDDTLTKIGAVADAKATGDAIAAVGNSGSVVVEMENGSYASTANRYSDQFSGYCINRKPILMNGAEKIKISGFPTTLVDATVLFRSNDGTAISSASATLENGGTGFVNVPSGAFYADLQTDNFDYRKYSITLTSFGAKDAPRQVKRIYSNQGGTTIVRFHLDKDSNLNTCTAFRLPPNYSSNGAAVPLVIFFAGSMDYPTITSGFKNNYSDGINYVRDEGFAIMQVFSWGSEYATKYPQCGNDQPFSVPICLFAIRKGIEYMCDRYNIDPENVHVVAKSVGGIIANYFASRPVWPFKSISMFAPCLDFISMRGRYADGRRAIAEELDLQGDLTTFFSLSYWYFSEEGKAFWSQNKEKLIQLNPAWLDMIGGNFSDNFDETFADGQAWWANKSRTDVYDQTGYYRLAKIPVKIWGAPDDPETPYPIMETTIKQLQNSGCFSELHTLPTGTGGHSADTGSGNAVASITTALGITHTNVPIAWAECVPWMLVNSPHFAREIPEPEPDPDVPADCPYIENGLIFWLDGKTVESNSKWVDLVGGLEFALANCTKNANGVVFNGSTSVGTHTGSITGSTIEVAFTTANTTGNISIMCQPNSAISAACAISSNNSHVVTTFGSTNYRFRPITRGGVELISATAPNGENRVVINKTLAGNGLQTIHWDANTSGKIAIGGRFTNSESVLWGFSGTIHSIRIYNRELTEAEMIANQNVDISRFGLSV